MKQAPTASSGRNPTKAPAWQRTQSAETSKQVLGEVEDEGFEQWVIHPLAILLLAGSIVAVAVPNVAWNLLALRREGSYVSQLLFGCVAVLVLLSIHAVRQRRLLWEAREEAKRHRLDKEEAERLSLIDPLTELYNRRYMDKFVAKEMKRTDRSATSFAVLMIDVDDFKSVNTRFGHAVGDRLLRVVAQILKNTFRGSDSSFRYGGDEFLAVMPEANAQQAELAIQRLKDDVLRWNEANVSFGYTMSLSCGFAAYTKGGSITEVLQLADQRMYSNKLGEVCPSQPPLETFAGRPIGYNRPAGGLPGTVIPLET